MDTAALLERFLNQANSGDLKTSTYPKEWKGLKMKVSFGMGAAARVPWIAFTAPEITVSKGYYPVYLYYKDLSVLVLAYGISETNEFDDTWPPEVTNNTETIKAVLGPHLPRYGDSYVFKVYKLVGGVLSDENNYAVSDLGLESDLEFILKQYQQITSIEAQSPLSTTSQGIFYLEKQLEDFIIHNWSNTDLGKKYDLIIEDGELRSQQYRTEIGPIDILAKDKTTNSHIVIELKKNQTSDDTIGQIARYMGWVEEKLGDKDVRGVIIAQSYDRKLEFALKRISGVEVYIYEVDFRLKEFKN